MFRISRQPEIQRVRRAAFTLVEMLVAVALVLLMMTMFAEVFRIATDSMSRQKGIAELDQRQRLVSTLLRDDLRQRSFRNVYPYHPSDNTIHVQSANRPMNIPFTDRLGYIYISENDPENDLDDLLQLTVTKTDGTVFYGRTRELIDQPGNGAARHPNQPENDDGAFYGEGMGVGTSPSAEIAYFLRNGILYRRILLIRRPSSSLFTDRPRMLTGESGETELVRPGIYPVSNAPAYIFVSGGTAASRFAQDFDYSATYDFSALQVAFQGETSLSNAPLAGDSLGHPRNRFGFQRPTGLPAMVGYPIGLPKEYLSTGEYMGRFTHEETSHPAFAWPGDPGFGGDNTIATGDDTNPYTRTGGLAMSPNGVITLYAGGPRQGEDILLTNVQSFDIKIWDPSANVGPDGQPGIAGIDDDGVNGIDDAGELGWPGSDDGAFVDIGHTGIGFYSQTNNLNQGFGPLTTGNRAFDTWHPDLGSSLGRAPFRPARVGADGQPGLANFDDDGNGVDDNIEELGWPNTDDVPIPIKAIQIRIRYLDVSSGLVRDLTIIEQLSPDIL